MEIKEMLAIKLGDLNDLAAIEGDIVRIFLESNGLVLSHATVRKVTERGAYDLRRRLTAYERDQNFIDLEEQQLWTVVRIEEFP